MLLAIDKQAILYLFDSEEQVLNEFETIDVENTEYEFCDETGRKLVAKITKPVTRFRGGSFRLIQVGNPDENLPMSFINKAREIGRSCSGISNLDDLKKLFQP